jgi:ABC-type antimicrobial peptide transport system permease subunit
MLGGFAAAAVTLAAIGLYSLFMLVVADRGREIAVRLAVGADPQQVVRLVAAGAGRLLRGAAGANGLDATSLATAVGVLTIACGLAVIGPAMRAARIPPLDSLRDNY